MAECKIIGLNVEEYTKAYTYRKVDENGVTVTEYKGFDKELNKYISEGWRIQSITHESSTLYVALVR